MRVLTIGSDPTLLAAASRTRERMRLYATAVEELHIVLPAPSGTPDTQEGNLFLHPVSGGKLARIQRLARRARALILAYRIDVVSAQDPFAYGLSAIYAARGTAAAINIQIHTDLAMEPLWRRYIAFHVLRRANTIRVVSEKIRRDLAPRRLAAPITVLPMFIDLEPFRAIEHHAHARFAKTILWIGRFEPEKNPLGALRILEAVRATGIDAGLILLGAGSLEKQLRAEAKEFGAQVEFPGWQDPKPYLAAADVVAVTSLRESYGASIVESLAAGIPVVAPDVGVAREAGAIVVPRAHIAASVSEVLRSGRRGRLLLEIPGAENWTKKWRESLA
ncbi:glycosyltransferase [Patescibacteria group bacterium]|nr:glycosyltransferase [Patescibacteria group bacterium]